MSLTEVSVSYECKLCEYSTYVKCNYNKHCLSNKHKMKEFENAEVSDNTFNPLHICDKCKEVFDTRSKLWKHNKICSGTISPTINDTITNDTITNDTNTNEANNLEKMELIVKELVTPLQNKISDIKSNLITELIKQNKDTQKQAHDFQMQLFNLMVDFMKKQSNNIDTINIDNDNDEYDINNDNSNKIQDIEKFSCTLCNTKCSRQSEWNRHIISTKHVNLVSNNTAIITPSITTYNCKCGKEYKHRQSLFSHKKLCKISK